MKRFISLFLALLLSLGAAAPLVLAYSVPSDTIVYVTDTGTKYHRSGCSYLTSSHALTIEEAEGQGYGPCSRCDPDRKVGAYGNQSAYNDFDLHEDAPSEKAGIPCRYKSARERIFFSDSAFFLAIILSAVLLGLFYAPGILRKHKRKCKTKAKKKHLFSDESASKKRAYTVQLFGIGCHILAGILLAFVYFSGLYFENFWIIEIILAVLGMLLIYSGALALKK